MKILLLENKGFIVSDNLLNFKSLKLPRHEVRTLSEELLAKPIEEIAKEISENHSDVDLFIINAHLLVAQGNRSECSGIHLLKFIRLYNRDTHCILYSFLSREQLMQLSPYHSFIFSKGVKFVRLPCDLSTLNFEELIERKAPQDLSSYFKAEYQLPDNRHFMANWWGMLQLWNVQKAIEHNASKTNWQDIEKDFSISIKEMYSYQGLIARYLNKNKEGNIERELHFSTAKSSLEEIRGDLQTAKPKIVYVDDQANEGWSFILQRMIYGQDSDLFIPIVPQQNDSIDLIVTKINNNIKKDAKLLILDIRLKNETGQMEPSQLSGFQVLKQLQKYFIPCPVLIISASNKIWSIKETFSYSAVAFWTKEGLDAQMDARGSVENYLRLVDLVYSLINNFVFFKVISDIKKCIHKINNSNTDFWWETKFWEDKFTYKNWKKKHDNDPDEITRQINKTKSANGKTIIDILKRTIKLIESQLIKDFLLGNIVNPDLLFPSVIVNISCVLEEIHREDEKDKESNGLGLMIKSQLPNAFYVNRQCSDLWKKRNDAVHHSGTITKTIFEVFIDNLISYLSVDSINYELYKEDEPKKKTITNDSEDKININNLSAIRDALVKGEEVEVRVVSTKGNFVNFCIDSAESASIFSREKNGTAIIPNPENIKRGSIIVIKKADENNGQEDRGLIYWVKNETKNPMLKFVRVVKY